MGTFEEVVRVITDNLFAQVSILIGLIALVGLILQRKPFDEVVAGALRATIGVVILNIGVEIFTGGLSSFQVIVSSAMGLDPPEATSTLAEFSAGSGSVVPLIIAGGFVVHLALVRIFPAARFVYLTGHLMYWMSVVIAASLVEAFGDVNRWALAGVGSILIGCYWVLQPLWTAPLMRKVMGDEEVGLAHTDSLIAIASGYGARALKLGDPAKHDSEKVRLPKPVSFFKDINVSTATIIGVIMLVAILFADSGVVQEQMGDATVLPWVWAILQALRFAAGIAILAFRCAHVPRGDRPGLQGTVREGPAGYEARPGPPGRLHPCPHVGHDRLPRLDLRVPRAHGDLRGHRLVRAGTPDDHAVLRRRRRRRVRQRRGRLARGDLRRRPQRGRARRGPGHRLEPVRRDRPGELATLADADWYAVGWALIGLGSLFAPLGAWAIWVIAAIVLAVTIVVLVVLGRRLPAPEQTPAPPSGDRVPTAVGVATDGADGADTLTEPVSTTLSSNARPTPLDVLAVCGAGMGSSLILRTTAEKAFDRMGVDATLRHTDVGSARGEQPDMVVAQQTYLEELGDIAPVMVPIDNFINVDHVEGRILDALEKEGWR